MKKRILLSVVYFLCKFPRKGFFAFTNRVESLFIRFIDIVQGLGQLLSTEKQENSGSSSVKPLLVPISSTDIYRERFFKK